MLQPITINQPTWRFFFYMHNSKRFCYDCYTNKIYLLSDLLYNLLKSHKYAKIRKYNSTFFENILQTTEKQPHIYSENNCVVTIDFSNTCNLCCKYCYTKKNQNIIKTKKEDLEQIIRFFRFDFMPNAEQFCFSLGYSGESSFELDYLIHFDSLIAKYEGYLFSESLFENKYPSDVFTILPEEIKRKYPDITHKNNSEIINVLNDILMKESLWNYYDFSNNQYLSSMLEFTKKPSLSKRVIANRQIINDYFKTYNLKEKIKFMSMSFMTNGTNITDEYIEFIKSIYMKEIWVSFDGLQENHNKNRCYYDGSGSFIDVLNGIRKLQKNDITVNASLVVTPTTCNIYESINYMLSLGIKYITIAISRGNNIHTIFGKDQIDILLENFDKIYSKLLVDLKNKDYRLLESIKNNFFILSVGIIGSGNGNLARCKWGTEIIIDPKGDIYHCNSTIGNPKDYMGNWKTNINVQQLFKQKNVNDYKRCKKCFAKYLCGGTCYAEEINNHKENIKAECYFRKEITKKCILFYTQLKSENLLSDFISEISIK